MKMYLAAERFQFSADGGQPEWAQQMDYLPKFCGGVRRRLFSFFYHGLSKDGRRTVGGRFIHGHGTTQDVLLSRDSGMDLFLDSGGFTAFTKGETIGVEQYAEFIHRTEDFWTTVSNLDTIGDAAATYETQKDMESLGCVVRPVFHAREDTTWLKKYLDEGYDHILIGGMVPESTAWLISWLDDLWSRYLTNPDGTPRVKVHGFGLTDQTLMLRYPWHSVDSSSWLMAGVFGACSFITQSGLTKVIFSEASPEARKFKGWHYLNLSDIEKKQVDRWLEPTGITAQQCTEHYGYRDLVNAMTFQRLEEYCPVQSFKKPTRGLFDDH